MILKTLLEDPEQYMILRSLLEGPDTMEAPGHMSPGHMSTRTSVSPGHMSTRTHVYPDKNARTPVARTHIPRTTGAASLNTTVRFDMKMSLHTPPTHHRNFSGTSRRVRDLKFGTDTH